MENEQEKESPGPGRPAAPVDLPRPLGAHLEELRRAILYPLILWGLGMVVGLAFQKHVVRAVMRPMLEGMEKAKKHAPDKFHSGIEKLTPQPAQRSLLGADGSIYIVRQNVVSQINADLTRGWECAFESPILAVAVSADGQRIAAAAVDGKLSLLDAGNGNPIEEESLKGVDELRFSRDGRNLIIAALNGEVHALGRDGGELTKILEARADLFSRSRLLTANLEPMSVFMVIMKAAMIFGLILGIPFLIHSLWRFALPGLLPHEVRAIKPLLWFIILLFLVGAAFAYFVVLPSISMFLYLLSADVSMPMWNITKVVDMTLVLVLMFGLVFQMPLVLIFITRLGLVHPDTLAENRRVVWIGMFIMAAVLTPPDPISQLLMGVPTIVLFELGIVLSRVFLKRSQRAGAAIGGE